MTANAQQQSEWTTKRLLQWTTDYLKNVPVDQPRLAAEILLAHVPDCPRIELYTRFDHCPQPEQLTAFRELVRRCARHEPVAYLTDRAHFYGLTFKVTPAVLIPRPETELLVTQALNYISAWTTRPTVDVLDLCTGSACVAIALAANAVEAEVLALDSSPATLDIARENIKTHNLQGRVRLLESDLFANLGHADRALFDIIIANPPYITADEFQHLDPNVRDYEPQEALLAGPDGLDIIRRILDHAQPYLADNAALMIEIAYNQAEPVLELFHHAGYLEDITPVKDDLGHQRVIKARKK